MPPRPYYDVNPCAYMFGKSGGTPEEKVRQWVLFELLSTYGISINNIEIERPVKVGTRTHFADIVTLRDSAPYIVIECKKWGDRNKVRGMQQAVSYADASTVKARYAVYTNGDVWAVKRKMGESWVEISDLPKHADGKYLLGMDELLHTIDDLQPALFWCNQTVPAAMAKAYFSSMQVLFSSSNYPLNHLDKNLRFGTDLLLRVMSGAGDSKGYVHQKMSGACREFDAYCERTMGNGPAHDFSKDDVWQLTVDACARFGRIVEDIRGLTGQDFLHVRLIAALLYHLRRIIQRRGAKVVRLDVPSILTRQFHDLVEYLFQVHLGVGFPDPVVEEGYAELRNACSAAWERFRKEMG